MEIKTEAFATIDKVAKKQGNGAMVLVPKNWMGKKVRILLIEKNVGGSSLNLSNSQKKIWDVFMKNAVKEMRVVSKRALSYADELEKTVLVVEQDALIENFSREFNHTFSEIEIKR